MKRSVHYFSNSKLFLYIFEVIVKTQTIYLLRYYLKCIFRNLRKDYRIVNEIVNNFMFIHFVLDLGLGEKLESFIET